MTARPVQPRLDAVPTLPHGARPPIMEPIIASIGKGTAMAFDVSKINIPLGFGCMRFDGRADDTVDIAQVTPPGPIPIPKRPCARRWSSAIHAILT